MKTNKLFALMVIAVFAATSCNQSQKNEEANTRVEGAPISITLKGSDSVLPLSQKEAEKYMNTHPGASVTVVGGGSGVGIASLMEGTTDIAMSSRELKTDERMKLEEANKKVTEVIIAYDALAVVVHPTNKVSQLTREQLEGIFTGKISNWKEVGGSDSKIIAYTRESSSGTYEFFKEHVMSKKNFASTALSLPATGAIIQSVSQTPGAIGYVGLAYVSAGVKAVAVSYDQGATFVSPSVESAKSKAYPIARPLLLIYDSAIEAKVKPYIDYVLSDESQKSVAEVGYVPIR